MGIGASVFLIAVGAILTFALDVHISGVNIAVVGVILMLVGLVGFIATFALYGNRRWWGGDRVVREREVPVERARERDYRDRDMY